MYVRHHERGGARPAPGSCTAAASTRSRTTSAPTSPSSSCPRACRSRSRASCARRRSLLRRHARLGAHRLLARPPAHEARAASASGSSRGPTAARVRGDPRRAQARVELGGLGAADADDRPADRRCRSARALDRYGPDFTYGHYIAVKQPAARRSGCRSASAGAVRRSPRCRRRATACLLAPQARARGRRERAASKSWFKVRFVGEGGGKRVVTEVAGGDPGYGETSKMLAESALCLAFDDLPDERRPGDHRRGDGRRADRAPASAPGSRFEVLESD